MSFTPHELHQLALTFPRAHAAQISAKSAKYGVSREDIRQELSLICLEQGSKYDPAKGNLEPFLLGYLDKKLRQQLGAHSAAISIDSDDGAQQLIESLAVPTDDDGEALPSSAPNEPGVAKILSVAQFISGKSSSELARLLQVTPRRIRQILQRLREQQMASNQFELVLEEKC